MRAVNLIPEDARRGGGAGAGGRSGGAAYALLGGLAMLVVLVGVWTLSGRGMGEKRSEIASLQRETAAAQAQSGSMADSGQEAALAKSRVDTVRSLAKSRFDWAKALDAISRTLPTDAWLTSMTGTVAPGVAVEGSNGSGAGLRSSLAVPAVELVGCTTSQRKVALLMARLHAVPGVDRVTLGDAVKGQSGSGGAAGASGTGDCRGTRAGYPQFSMVLFFTAPAVAAPAVAAPVAPIPASITPQGSTG